MEGDVSFALGWLFGLCFALFALVFSGPLTFWLAKYSNFFRRLRRQRLLDDYARFVWMMRADNFECYLQIRNEAYLSETLPDDRLALWSRKLWRRVRRSYGKGNRRRPRR